MTELSIPPTIHTPPLALALSALAQQQAVGFPTETVWGLGALACQPEAVAALSRLKGRPLGKALQVSCHTPDQARKLLAAQPRLEPLLALLPGPLTLVGWAAPQCPPWLQFEGKVGVRVPDHAIIQQLLAQSGPLATTSLNPAGQPAALTYEQAAAYGLARVLLPDDMHAPPAAALPSTVIDCTTGQILRPGRVPEAALRPLLDSLVDGV